MRHIVIMLALLATLFGCTPKTHERSQYAQYTGIVTRKEGCTLYVASTRGKITIWTLPKSEASTAAVGDTIAYEETEFANITLRKIVSINGYTIEE